MKSLLHLLRIIAAVTLVTAHNLFRLGGFNTVPLRLAFDDDPDAVIMETLGTMTRRQDSLISDFSRLEGETKRAFEDLTKVKNSLNSIAEFEQKLRRVQLSLGREQRMAFGDPIKRIQVDDELRTRLNAAVRLACKDPAIRQMGTDMSKGLVGRSLTTGETPGSTMITSELATEIYDVLASYGIWSTFGVRRMGRATTRFPVTTARPVAKAVRKLASRKLVEDTTLAGTSVDCEVVLWGVLLGVERELLEDAEYDVTSYVLENFGEAIALKLDELCLTADGTDDETDSGMYGVFETGTDITAAAGNTTVETTDLDDWVACLTGVADGALTRPCRWWILQDTMEDQPGYCGRNERSDKFKSVDSAKLDVEAGRRDVRTCFLHRDEWVARLAELCDQYNNEVQEGRMLRGMSPREAWEQLFDHSRPLVRLNGETRYLLANHRRPLKVTRNGICVQLGKERHWFRNEFTGRHVGRPVQVYFDPEDLSSVFVKLDLNDESATVIPAALDLPAMSANREQMAAAMASVAAQNQPARTLYQEIKPYFADNGPAYFRRVVADEAAVELGREISADQEAVRSTQASATALDRQLSSYRRRYGTTPTQEAVDPRAQDVGYKLIDQANHDAD